MAPKRRKASSKNLLKKISQMPPEKSLLDRLPMELVERICDFFPHRDTLLSLRASCRELEAKTASRYYKAYFEKLRLHTNPKDWRKIVRISYSHHSLALSVNSLSLFALDSHLQYENYKLAKGWRSGASLAKACNTLVNLRRLAFDTYKFSGCRNFLANFARCIRLPQLKHLQLDSTIAESESVAEMISNHKHSLNKISLYELDLQGGRGELAKAMADDESDCEDTSYNTPWSTVFTAMLEIETPTDILIEKAMHFGKDVDFLATLDCMEEPEMKFWETTITMVPDFRDMSVTDEDDYEFIQEIKVPADSHWRKGIKRLKDMYEYDIEDESHDGTPWWCYDSDGEYERKKKAAEEGSGPGAAQNSGQTAVDDLSTQLWQGEQPGLGSLTVDASGPEANATTLT